MYKYMFCSLCNSLNSLPDIQAGGSRRTIYSVSVYKKLPMPRVLANVIYANPLFGPKLSLSLQNYSCLSRADHFCNVMPFYAWRHEKRTLFLTSFVRSRLPSSYFRIRSAASPLAHPVVLVKQADHAEENAKCAQKALCKINKAVMKYNKLP